MAESFTVFPLSGEVYSTDFKITELPSGNFIKYVWDFGNNKLIYNEQFPSIVYQQAGVQKISLTATDILGNKHTFIQTVTTEFPFRDYIKFIDVPDDYADPGLLTNKPFKIEVLCSQIEQPLNVDLYAANTFSIPSQFVYKRWEFLNPTWKFLDVNLKKIETLSIHTTPVYKNNTIVALSGTGEFYFIDSLSKGDLSENKPLLITATLQTSGFINPADSSYFDYPSYSNSETVRAGILWYVNDLSPRLLKVTSNYLDNLPKEIWATIKTPFLVTCHGNKSLQVEGAPDRTSEVLFNYPATNDIGNLQPLDINLENKTKQDFAIGNNNQYTDLYFQSRDNKNFRLGGYIFDTITPNADVTTNSSSLMVKATAYNLFPTERGNKFVYPVGSAPNTAAWIPNSTHNIINKINALPYQDNCPTINYFKEKKALTDGFVKQVNIPSLTSINTFNYSYTEGTDVYSIVVDPRDNSAIAADITQNKLFKFSTTGELLSTFDFFDIDRQNGVVTTTWTVSSLLPSGTNINYVNPIGAPLYQISDIYISPDGTKAFILDKITRELYSYNILISNNLNTLQYSGHRFNFILTDTQPSKIFFKPDGTKMYMFGKQTGAIFEYQLQTPWNIQQGVTFLGSKSFNTPANQFNTTCFEISENGATLFVGGTGIFGGLRIYSLNTPWRIQTSLTPNVLLTPEVQNISDIVLTPQNTDQKLFIFDKELKQIFEYSFTNYLNFNSIYKTNKTYTFNEQLIEGFLINPLNFTSIVIDQNNTLTEYYFDRIQHGSFNAPSHITLDENCNMWVSLFNSVSVVKIDKDFNYLFSVAPTGINLNEIYDGDYLLKPPVVETDKDNNCWATYAHPLCCLLVKYSPTGSLLAQIPLEKYSVPNGLAITPNNDVWVMNSFNVLEEQGSFILYNGNTFNRLKTIPIRFRPTYFSLDRDANIWYTYGVRRFGFINTENFSTNTWQLSYEDTNDPFFSPTFITKEEKRTDELLGGLSVDVFNRVWLIDSFNSNVWLLSASPNFKEQNFKKIKILPAHPKGYFLNIPDNTTITQPVNQFTIQAAGDWTGNKWYQKYCNQTTLSSIELSGASTKFKIKPFLNNYEIRRHNETFDMAGHLQTLALEENFANNNLFFKNFLGTAIGDSTENVYQDTGQTIYERIANFTNNHADIDTCNIDQLISHAENTNVPYLDYGILLPVDAKNLLDIASIPRHRLCGIPDNIPFLLQSIGQELDYFTATVSAGEKMVLRSRLTNKYTVTILPVINNQFVYQLSAFNSNIFEQPISKRYQFYTFIPKYSGDYIENIIDWKSEYTTLNPTMTSYNDWYGDEGIIENNFKYILTKNLFTK